VHQPPDSEAGSEQPARSTEDVLADRVEALSAWITEIDTRVHATVAVTGDRKTARDLRRAIEALSKRDPKFEDRLTNQVQVVADRLTTLGKTVNTTAASLAAKDGEIATLRRELQEGNARIEEVVAELRRTVDTAGANEVRRMIAARSEERPQRKGDDRRVDGLSGKVDVFAQRLDTLAGTVATTAAGLAGREGELAALRRKLDNDTARVEAAIGELRTSVDPTPVLELRQTVKTLSDETSALKRSSRRGLDGVSSRVDTLARHLDSLVKTVGTTAAGIAEKEGEIAALRSSFDEENARLDSLVVKLHQAIGELSSQVAAVEGFADRDTVGALDDRLGGLTDKVETFAGRLDALGSTVTAATKDHADNKLELAALSRRFEEANSRIGVVVDDLNSALEARGRDASVGSAEVERRIGEVAHRIDALEQSGASAAAEVARRFEATDEERESIAEAARGLEDRITGMSGQVEDLAAQLDALASTVDATAKADAGKEAEVAALTRRFETASARVDVLVGDLRTALETLPEPRVDPEFETRFDGLEQDVRGFASQVQQVEAATSTAWKVAAAASADVELHLAQVTRQLEALEQGRAALAAEAARASEAWTEERAWVREQLEVVASHADVRHELAELNARLAVIEGDRERVARTEAAPHVDEVTERGFAELAGRLDAMERDREAVAAELAGVRESWGSDRSSLESRLGEVARQLGEVARQLAEVESAAASSTPESASSEREIWRVRDLVDGLRTRMASSEQKLAALAGSREVDARLDELTWRLDSLENTAGSITAPSSPPLPGEGRFRLELRGLELRMEHAEAAARENREAVLMQLERVASRIEWRLQRLEAVETGAAYQPAGGFGPVGQVVPIRGTETS